MDYSGTKCGFCVEIDAQTIAGVASAGIGLAAWVARWLDKRMEKAIATESELRKSMAGRIDRLEFQLLAAEKKEEGLVLRIAALEAELHSRELALVEIKHRYEILHKDHAALSKALEVAEAANKRRDEMLAQYISETDKKTIPPPPLPKEPYPKKG